jgi:hypothetical protein
MEKKSASRISSLPVIGWAIIFSLCTFLITSCGGGNSNDKPATTQADTSKVKTDTTQSASIKDKLTGNWIQQESGTAIIKLVFTNKEAIKYNYDQKDDTYKYKWINDKEIEMEIKGMKIITTITITGDDMVMDTKEIGPVKYKREQANTINEQTGLAKPPAKMLTGKWTMTSGRIKKTMEFKEGSEYSWTIIDTPEDPQFGPETSGGTISYRFVNENTVEVFNYYSKEVIETATFSIEDNGDTLAWVINGETVKYKREKTN